MRWRPEWLGGIPAVTRWYHLVLGGTLESSSEVVGLYLYLGKWLVFIGWQVIDETVGSASY